VFDIGLPTSNFYKRRALILHLDKKRLTALSRQDALAYFSLCDLLGVEPEDTPLYDLGAAEHEAKKKPI